MVRPRWTREEDEFLINNWGKHNWNYLYRHLHRSRDAIYARATKTLGLPMLRQIKKAEVSEK